MGGGCRRLPLDGRMLGAGALRPRGAEANGNGLKQMYGDVWEWTASAYLPYPGFKAAPGAVGEYNGKFMCNQFVLAAAPAPRRKATSVRPTATSSIPISAGSSWG